jgi:methyl coenzyme M reductase subunit C-like uncharacterized protein (methanogenesis marker protein 7)
MLFSNTDVRYNFNFTFNGNNIPITMSHKHLGVTLSSDAKWNNHIENIPVSEYNLSVFVKIGNPVTILAASSCNFQAWLNNTLHNYPIFHRHIQKLGGYILSTVFLDFVYLTYILIFAEDIILISHLMETISL